MTMTPSTSELMRLISRLGSLLQSNFASQAFTGFDGFVDKIQKVVKRKLGETDIFFRTITEFSGHLHSLAAKSGQLELVTSKISAGGNAPILSNAFGKLGVRSFCLGSMGTPVHSAFKQIHPYAELISVAAPGQSQALEFNDGKIILSELDSFFGYDWKYIKSKVDLSKIKEVISSCQLIALVDWANLPHASDIWQGILQDIIKPGKKRDLFFLFDLCDPSKKSAEEIDEVVDLISSFSPYGKVTLVLNENEANKIWMALNGHDLMTTNSRVNLPPLHDIGSSIFQTMVIDTLLIHPIDCTLAFQKHKALELNGRVVMKPKVLTGGGDNLNAGYSLGLMDGMDISQCMLLGMATSGAYVQNGECPGLEDLINYLDNWLRETKSQSKSAEQSLWE